MGDGGGDDGNDQSTHKYAPTVFAHVPQFTILHSNKERALYDSNFFALSTPSSSHLKQRGARHWQRSEVQTWVLLTGEDAGREHRFRSK